MTKQTSSLNASDPSIYDVRTHAAGPAGKLPLDEDYLRNAPSGDLFGLTQDAGMGWDPAKLRGAEFLILGTMGGIRAPDGTPIALGYHVGHWEVGVLMQAAAEEFSRHNAVPFAGYVSDPCDGRTQGTPGMMDSLAYRNDAAIVLRRLIRSLPTRRGVMGVASCDKGLPAMMMALAGQKSLPGVIVPGGVTLLPAEGEDAGKVQSLGARFAHGLVTMEEAAELGCRACASPGGGCQFLGTAATSQVIAEALGLAVAHSALSPSGQPIWLDMARRARACADGVGRAPPLRRRHPDRRRVAQRDGDARGVRRQHQPDHAHPRHRPRRQTAPPDRRRLGSASIAGCRAWWTCCRTARPATARCRSSWPAASPR